ncbi:MAG: hypothetical protein EPN39_14765 [Chitinophagaceae bacterium]|nr:MAG: hypothetical protein EPN39_14765 [Chitinophagaceae bacterium]
MYILLLLSLLFSFNRHGKKTKEDYALFSHSNEWPQDYAMVGPFWDMFERFPGNPIYRGHKGREWPVI